MQRRQMQTSSNGTSALSPRKRFAAAFRHSATPPRDTGNEIFVESYPPGSHLFHRYPGGSTRQTAAPGSGSSVNTTWKIFLLTAAAVFPEPLTLTHTHTHKNGCFYFEHGKVAVGFGRPLSFICFLPFVFPQWKRSHAWNFGRRLTVPGSFLSVAGHRDHPPRDC